MKDDDRRLVIEHKYTIGSNLLIATLGIVYIIGKFVEDYYMARYNNNNNSNNKKEEGK